MSSCSLPCMGAVNAFDIPARQAFLVEMVGRSDLMNAIALNSSNVDGTATAWASGGRHPRGLDRRGLVYSNSTASAISRCSPGYWPCDCPRRKSGHRRVELGHIIEGIQYVARTGPIHTLLLLLGLISLTGTPFSVLMPIFADRILHGGPGGYGASSQHSGVGQLDSTLILAAQRVCEGWDNGWPSRQWSSAVKPGLCFPFRVRSRFPCCCSFPLVTS